jgi:ATP-binding cassette, subfamily B, bacterial PglK
VAPDYTLTARQREVLLRQASRDPRTTWALAALAMLSAVLEASSVFAVLPLAAALTGGPGRGLSAWGPAFAGLLALLGLRSAALMSHARLSARAASDAAHAAKCAVLRAYAGAPDSALVELRGGRVAQRLFRGGHSAGVLTLRVPQFAAEAARAAGLVLMLLWLDPRLAAGLAAVGTAVWLLFSRVLSPRAYHHGRERSDAEARERVVLHEFLQGVRQLRLARALEPWSERFEQASREAARHQAELSTLQALPGIWFETAAAAAVLGWVLLAAWREPGRAPDLPLLAAVAVGAGKLMPCLASLGRHRLELLGALADAVELEDFLAGASRAVPSVPAGPRAELRSELRLEGVRFSFPGRPELLKGADLAIPAGSCVALYGPYGSGKTTVLELLLGLRQPSAGRVLLDGRPLRELDRASWWEGVGVVPQDAFLIHGSVEENIRLDRAGHGRGAVEAAARAVGAHEFIAALPRGYETVVGERGLSLSGGQRQLLLLARALLTDPPVLLLDEPAQGLDPAAQERLSQALRLAARGRTVVLALHRPEWASWADAVVELEDGVMKAGQAA